MSVIYCWVLCCKSASGFVLKLMCLLEKEADTRTERFLVALFLFFPFRAASSLYEL